MKHLFTTTIILLLTFTLTFDELKRGLVTATVFKRALIPNPCLAGSGEQ